MERIAENNQVTITGKIVSDFRFSHQVYGEGFYMADIEVSRLSNLTDTIPLLVSERLVDVTESHIGKIVTVSGQFRSHNRYEEDKYKLILSVFTRNWQFVDEIPKSEKTNQIYLDGFICRTPVYRETPLGREIADLLIAVNRPYGKCDYIPCITWGRNARYVSTLEVGRRIQVWGRVQSREYLKKISEDEVEKRIAYEVSVNKIYAQTMADENDA